MRPPARLIRTGLASSRFHCLAAPAPSNLHAFTNEPPAGAGCWRAAWALASLPLCMALASGVLAQGAQQNGGGGDWYKPIKRRRLPWALHVDGFFEAIGIELTVGYGGSPEKQPVLACRDEALTQPPQAARTTTARHGLKIVDAESGLPSTWV